MTSERWPSLPLNDWKDTYATLHRWVQIVGKTRLALTPLVNHWWNSTLYVSARGLTTSTIHTPDLGFEVEFDFVSHVLNIRTSASGKAELPLRAQYVADFYNEYLAALRSLGIDVHIHGAPNEIEDATPFAEDHAHASYDPEYANRLWRILFESDRVFKEFRARFVGKSSPVHFFWGGFDLALTRFSGRRAPPHPGGAVHCPDWVMTEGYSHELTSAGFWPGGAYGVDEAVFYGYAYPEPAGFSDAVVEPAAAHYDKNLREFNLPYEALRTDSSPDSALLDFLQSTYEAAAILGKWDRSVLERVSPEVETPPLDEKELAIHENPEKKRFETTVRGHVALVDYRRRGNTIYFTHTEVPPALEGRGIGSALARHVLEYAKANNLKVVPTCPFIAEYIRAHPEYSDLLKNAERQ